MSNVSHNLRKAAILVAALPPEEAEMLLGEMDAEQVTQIRDVLGRMDTPDSREQERVLLDFIEADDQVRRSGTDGVEMDLSFAGKIASDDGVLDDATAESGAPPSPLQDVPCALLAKALLGEHPQTIAVVLAQQSPQQATQVLVELPIAKQAEVARRLASIQLPPAQILNEINEAVQEALRHLSTQTAEQSHQTTLEAMLNVFDPVKKDRLLRELSAGQAPSETSEVHLDENEGLDFGDLIRFDDRSLLQVLAAVDDEIVLLALAGAPRGLIERLIAQLPAEEAAEFERRCEAIGPCSLRDVEIAQQRIVSAAVRLHQDGQIFVPEQNRKRVA